MVRRDLWVQPLCLRKALRAHCPEPHLDIFFNYLKGWRLHHLLGQPVAVPSQWKDVCWYSENLPCFSLWPLSLCCWAPLRRAWPYSLCTLPSGICVPQWDPSWAFSCLAEQCQKPDWSLDRQYPLFSPHLPRHPIWILESKDETRVKGL